METDAILRDGVFLYIRPQTEIQIRASGKGGASWV